MMASCPPYSAPETINSNTSDVADRCQGDPHHFCDFRHGVFGNEPWKRIHREAVACRGGAGIGAEGIELTAGKLAAFYDSQRIPSRA